MVTFTSDSLVCERYILGPLEVNTYLVYEKGSKEAILIDPADESQTLANRISELDFAVLTIFLTHGHADHLQGVEYFRSRFPFAKVAISAADAPMLLDPALNLSVFLGGPIVLRPADQILKENDTIKTGAHEGLLKSVSGHTTGGMILIFPGLVFCGDTLFAGSVGRSDFPGGNAKDLTKDISGKIFSLSDRIVFPGHGPETSISEEKNSNPFFEAPFTV